MNKATSTGLNYSSIGNKKTHYQYNTDNGFQDSAPPHFTIVAHLG